MSKRPTFFFLFLLFILIRHPTSMRKSSHQRCWFFQLSTINSIKVCASESACFSFPPFTMQWGDPSIHWVRFLSSLLLKNQDFRSSPYLYIYAASRWLLYIRPQTGSGLNQTFLKPSFYCLCSSNLFYKEVNSIAS